MPGDNILFKLSRLVTYKIKELSLLGNAFVTDASWNHVEKFFSRENHYARKAGFRPLENNYEKAMWAYYEFLEFCSLEELEKLKNGVKSQIKTSELKRKFIL